MIRIVGVHGVGTYRPEPPDTVAAAIAAEWTEALAASEHLPWRADEFELRIAYYAHLLREPGSGDGTGIDPKVGAMIGDFLKAIAPDPEDITGSWLPREAAAKLTELFGWNEALSMGFLGVFFGDDVHDDIDAPLFHDESYYLRSRQLGLALADWDVDSQHV